MDPGFEERMAALERSFTGVREKKNPFRHPGLPRQRLPLRPLARKKEGG